jgi:hypothetical protein
MEKLRRQSLTAFGWEVGRDIRRNPFEQEVRVERSVSEGLTRPRADYGFYLNPNFRDMRP